MQAVSKVTKSMNLYRLPFAAIGLAMILGVVVQDLLFDLGCAYFAPGREERDMPRVFFLASLLFSGDV
jgi:hypothetical protein